ncbi:MAG: sulfur carrier protein ThiS [Clostridia bacterium]|nr:sulfur carrier protein ThiS [Clostridia bacterium]
MKITVTGVVKDYNDGLSLKELIDAEQVQTPEYVTASVNDDLLGAREFETTTLKDGDVIEFLYFMGGGAC